MRTRLLVWTLIVCLLPTAAADEHGDDGDDPWIPIVEDGPCTIIWVQVDVPPVDYSLDCLEHWIDELPLIP